MPDGMDLEVVLGDLCWYDPRHPDYADTMAGWEDDPDKPEPRGACACDACFYGRDRLAVEVLRLRGLLGLPVALD